MGDFDTRNAVFLNAVMKIIKGQEPEVYKQYCDILTTGCIEGDYTQEQKDEIKIRIGAIIATVIADLIDKPEVHTYLNDLQEEIARRVKCLKY